MRRVILLLWILTSAAPALAVDPVSLQPTVGWSGRYRPRQWTPVEINITSNLKQPVEAVLTVSASQDDLTRMSVSHPLVLSPGRTVDVPLVTKLAMGADGYTVRIVPREGGRALFDYRYDLLQYGASGAGAATPITERDLLIGLVGRSRFGLSAIGRYVRPDKGTTIVARKDVRSLPMDWTGYVSLDLLVLMEPEWAPFHREQLRAIAEWLANGGRLVLIGGDPLAQGNPLSALLPVRRSGPVQTSVQEVSDNMPALGAQVGQSSVNTWTYQPEARSGWEAIIDSPSGPAAVAGPAGFGWACLVGFSPDQLSMDQPAHQARWWQRLLAKALPPERNLRYSEAGFSGDEPEFGHYYESSPTDQATNQVMEYLLWIPQLKPLSIWVVVGLLVAMTVVIGPVNYLVLRRMDKLPWTWATTLACIVVFSVLAYFGVQWLRGGEGRVRVVTISDHIAGTDVHWQTAYTGIFAPVDDDYRLQGLDGRWWWSAVAPQEDVYFGNRMDRATRHLGCVQVDGGNLPHSMPINIWSMQCYLAQGPTEPPAIEAEWSGNQREPSLTIHNRSKLPIQKAALWLSPGEMRELPDLIGAGQSVTVPVGRGRRPHTLHLSTDTGSGMRLPLEQLMQAAGVGPRSSGVDWWLRHGRSVLVVQLDTRHASRADVPYEVASRRCAYDHVRVARIVLPVRQEISTDGEATGRGPHLQESF